MEENWIQRVRHIAKLQAHGVVDAIINDGHHLILKRRNGQELDAGEIKTRRPGAVVTVAYQTDSESYDAEPDIYATRDGGLWLPASSQGRWQGGTQSRPNCGCWTGDRFLVPGYNYTASEPDFEGNVAGYSQILQSFDGGNWAFHPDVLNFSAFARGTINGIAASGEGVVLVVGTGGFGLEGDGIMAVSRDFGDTFEVYPEDVDRFPFMAPEFNSLHGACCKNNIEWVVGDGYNLWYTFDGGGRWGHVVFPNEFFYLEPDYGFPVRYFNGYWWIYGNGGGPGDEDTPLYKSENLVDWIPVVTPWSGTYPQLEPYRGYPHDSDSGYILNMEYDPFTNTVLCNGYNATSWDAYILMSTDGGLNFFEISFKDAKAEAEGANWDGYYDMPYWSIDSGGGMAWGFGWWYLSNPRIPDDLNAPILRISSDGRIVEPVTPDRQKNTYSYVLLAGGYLGMEKAQV